MCPFDRDRSEIEDRLKIRGEGKKKERKEKSKVENDRKTIRGHTNFLAVSLELYNVIQWLFLVDRPEGEKRKGRSSPRSQLRFDGNRFLVVP